MDEYFNEYEPIDMAPDDSDMYAVFPGNETLNHKHSDMYDVFPENIIPS